MNENINTLTTILALVKNARRELYYIENDFIENEATEKQEETINNAIDLTYDLEAECERLIKLIEEQEDYIKKVCGGV